MDTTVVTHALRSSSLPGLLALALSGCASVPVVEVGTSPWATASVSPAGAERAAMWEHMAFLGKTPTHFQYERKDGRDAVGARARASASMLRSVVRVEPDALGRLRFSWKVPELIAGADMAARDADDSPVRIVLAFEGDRSRFTARDALLSELARTLTGEELPYATLMYVWCNRRSAGSVITSPRTDRIRKLVVESGPGRLGQWLEYERDVRADFERAFGEPPGALVGVAIMSDTDNTRSSATAWYGPLSVLSAQPATSSGSGVSPP